jgi:hypothetical protein
MKALARLYTLGVLWLLSVFAKDAAKAIYTHGHDDGANALREHMREDLVRAMAAAASDRVRSYRRGFNDATWLFGDEPGDNVKPTERVM